MAVADPTPSTKPGEKAPRAPTLPGLGGAFPAPTNRFSAATRPPRGYRPDALKRRRFLKAYYVTFRVIFSYLWLKFRGKLFGKVYSDLEIAEVHRRNAKRIERALLELQGLFI